MDNSSWANLAIQIPVVALFAWVILKIFFKTKEFVDAILDKHQTFLASILNSHKEERENRDKEWREWLVSQRQSYLNSIRELTERVEEHHKSSIQQASEILTLLKQNGMEKK